LIRLELYQSSDPGSCETAAILVNCEMSHDSHDQHERS
jgi:hypothetical protein